MSAPDPVYLCGRIAGRFSVDCRCWREEAKRRLGSMLTLDPIARDYGGREWEPSIAREIVENDKKDIEQCGYLLVMFDKPSVEIALNIMYAYERAVPVYVVDASDKPLPPWMIYHATRICSTLAEACEAILAEEAAGLAAALEMKHLARYAAS
jgi:hypothetical protein